MHHIYHTEGFILSSRNVGEANKILTIYTREIGFVKALAQGVRLVKSKLRFALHDFSYTNIDLVRGKDIWRITSATPITSFPLLRREKNSLSIMAQVSKLIEKLCYVEQPNEIIFNKLIQSLYLLDVQYVEESKREALELYLVLNIMSALGYIGDSKILSNYLEDSFDVYKIENLLKNKKSIITHINKALNESQM
jgi:DNA repair protein RecO (recombination protein O)